METGVIKEFFDELLIESHRGVFVLCRGSEEAIRSTKSNFIGQRMRYYLLPSNKAVCVFR